MTSICRESPLAATHFPELFILIVEPKQPVTWIVPFAAIRAGNIAAQMHAFAVVLVGNGERRPAAARDEQHVIPICFSGVHSDKLYPLTNA